MTTKSFIPTELFMPVNQRFLPGVPTENLVRVGLVVGELPGQAKEIYPGKKGGLGQSIHKSGSRAPRPTVQQMAERRIQVTDQADSSASQWVEAIKGCLAEAKPPMTCQVLATGCSNIELAFSEGTSPEAIRPVILRLKTAFGEENIGLAIGMELYAPVRGSSTPAQNARPPERVRPQGDKALAR